MSEFKREDRYLVFKRSDIEKYLNEGNRGTLNGLTWLIDHHRKDDGKQPLQCVVVEHDWPEHEQVWKMIEARCSANEAPEKP